MGANGKLYGAIVTDYTQRDGRTRDDTPVTYYGVDLFFGGDILSLSLDEPLNGSALPVGSCIDVEVEFTTRRSVVKRQGGGDFVGRGTLSGRLVSMTLHQPGASDPAAAATPAGVSAGSGAKQ